MWLAPYIKSHKKCFNGEGGMQIEKNCLTSYLNDPKAWLQSNMSLISYIKYTLPLNYKQVMIKFYLLFYIIKENQS